ncbi:MAG TPA: 4-alpha-glucanotransferase [Kofleriaceae bacterium]|nr:4-alpha-glucanotransferase [Kofleriaceae bacterium]
MLRELARAAGIDADYLTWRGEPTAASDESITSALIALAPDLGIDATSIADPQRALALLDERRWSERVPPVVVAWDGELVVPMRVPAELDLAWTLEVTLETGGQHRARGRLFELAADSHAHPDGVVHCIRRAAISLGATALGYHQLHWTIGDQEGEMTGDAMIIAAPTRAWGGPSSFDKRWGVFAPVYGLASASSGQAGDLGTLRQLFEAADMRGGSYVATLPILAAFLGEHGEPCAWSPYSPASRLYWNELYVDLPRFAASLDLVVPSAPIGPFPQLIDYRAQYAWRRPILDSLATAFFTDPARRDAVAAWASKHGVFDYAAFRAIGEMQRAGWRAWPAELQTGTKLARSFADAHGLAGDRQRVDTHVFAQWAMQSQLLALHGHRVALYLDLPVGVSMDAYEVWRWRRLFLTELAAGAPPDALFLGGQNWGLPPMSPIALRRGRYKYFIDCVRHHMRVAGMLRVDHVMGLFRLYCIPAGRPATDGVYLRYPADELLAILTLESRRATCAIAGEDLGTVPDHVRPAMTKHGFYRLHVGQWAFPSERGRASEPSPAGAIASLNTHDTATFAGWWNGADIADARDLNLIDDAQDRAQRGERERTKAALVELAPPGPLADVERAMFAANAELANGPAEIVLIALDDLALELVPHNVPGTSIERPNWQRRVPKWDAALSDDKASPAAAATIAAVAAVRPRTE